jgi:hypothetical protein
MMETTTPRDWGKSMVKPTRADSFGTFLKTVQTGGVEETEAPARTSQTALLKLLRSKPHTIRELITISELGTAQLLGALKNLQDLRLVEGTGAPEGDVVQLTETGKAVAATVD